MSEIYKTKNDLSPAFKQEIFYKNENHNNLRNNNEFLQPKERLVTYSTDSIRFKGKQPW